VNWNDLVFAIQPQLRRKNVHHTPGNAKWMCEHYCSIMKFTQQEIAAGRHLGGLMMISSSMMNNEFAKNQRKIENSRMKMMKMMKAITSDNGVSDTAKDIMSRLPCEAVRHNRNNSILLMRLC
jgi:hypothetical protein